MPELLEQCRKGNRAAQRDLYALTCDRIYRLLLRMTGSPEDAFDLAQETYLKVFARISEFEGASDVATWIYRIAVNEGLQQLRREKRHRRKLQELTAAEGEGPEDATITRLDVREALGELPEYERTLIVLRHFDGLSYDEMAQVLDKPVGTIASALNRARRLLRDRLEQESPDPREGSPAGRHPNEE
jgi:RNA polymerase sigma-70 factor (ECF subfamily)